MLFKVLKAPDGAVAADSSCAGNGSDSMNAAQTPCPRLAAIRSALAKGTYVINSEDIANTLLRMNRKPS